MERIGLLIPTYNRASLLELCLQSIFAQTYPNIEIWIYDDGSTDLTRNMLHKYPEINVIGEKQNKGVSYARNRLLEACDTRVIAWQDSDDYSNIYRIEKQYNLMQETGAAMVFGECIPLHKAAQDAWKEEPTAIRKYNTRPFASIMAEREKALQIPFNEGVTLGAEDILWIERMKQNFGEPAIIHEQLYYIRMSNRDRLSVRKRQSRNRDEKQLSNTAYRQEWNKYFDRESDL